jgi:hypothetical protein
MHSGGFPDAYWQVTGGNLTETVSREVVHAFIETHKSFPLSAIGGVVLEQVCT